MTDRRPPKLAGGERDTLLLALQYLRDSMVHKVEGLDDAAARTSPVQSGTSLLWLLKHVSFAERVWIFGRFRPDGSAVPSNELTPDETVASLVDAYRQTWVDVDRVIGASALDDVAVESGGEDQVNLRWIVVHLIEEIARHAGHADIIRELIDGQTGR